MTNILADWMGLSGLIPHGYCLAWQPGLLWSLAISNTVIGLSYYSIPLALAHFIRRHKDLKFNWVFAMFAVFIFACGTTHFIDVLSIWVPVYRLDAIVLDLTAGVSLATAIMLWPLIPRASRFLEAHRATQQGLQESNARLKFKTELLEKSERQFRLTLDNAPIGLTIVGLDGRFLTVNSALCTMLGYTADELLMLTFQKITHADDLEQDLAHMNELLRGERDSYCMEKRYLDKRGAILFVQLDVSVLRDARGQPIHFIAQIQNISQRKRFEASLHEAKELAQITLSSIADGVIRTDAQGRISFVNAAAEQLLGTTGGQLIGQRFDEAVVIVGDGGGTIRMADPVAQVLAGGQTLRMKEPVSLRTSSGELRPISDSSSPILDVQGQVVGAVFVFHDASESRKITQQLTIEARRDPLTGLPNRLAFQELLKSALSHCAEKHSQDHLLYLDLDRFKPVNDSCGHAAGDRLLREVAALLKSALRSGDFLARLGGDEFAVVLRQCSTDSARLIAEKLLQLIKAYRLSHEGRMFEIGLSIGIAEIRGDDTDLASILAQADAACYAAKSQGRGRYCLYSADVF